jgi:hypothetical protein
MTLVTRTQPSTRRPKRRSLKALLTTLLTDVGANSQHLFADCLGRFNVEGQRYWLPRFIVRGARGEEPPLKIGIFAGIHGDEVAGILACFDLLRFFEKEPFLARAYHLHFYPLVNPTGFEDRTRHTRTGSDLNREFWRDSAQPEVRILEEEIQRQRFDGLISLHCDDTSEGLYGFVRGATLTKHLLKPALAAAEAALPINEGSLIDGFHAVNGIIQSCYDGVLSAPPATRPAPFEIILESPQLAPIALQRHALVLGVREIIREYRRLISFAADL